MGRPVRLGARLKYPITIVKLYLSPGDGVKKQEPALQYQFKWFDQVGDSIRGETWEEETTCLADWVSPVEGVLKEWRIAEGMTVERDCACALIDELCSHEIQFKGLCAICGEDMTVVNWASEQADTTRATINMTHDQTSLLISENLAARAENETQRRLLREKKLSLVVDLDQTIMQACIEPTIGEWQRDSSNPNFAAVKDVRSFQLQDDGPRGLPSGCWYYIKMRPGLADFLEDMSRIFEMHVYTMGTRAYALNIAKIVDPDQKYFGNRVISRDENGSMIAKSLQRLFPFITNMVAIIDDRADVWPRDRHNLIKVTPYDFFKGVGDINSSFLPQRPDTFTSQPDTPQSDGSSAIAEHQDSANGLSEDGVAINPPSAADEAVLPSTLKTADPTAKTQDPSVKTQDSVVIFQDSVVISQDSAVKTLEDLQSEEQEKSLEKQIRERPLLQLQEALDREDVEKEKASQRSGNGTSCIGHRRQHVLCDDDEELVHLHSHLTTLHTQFYKAYQAQTTSKDRPPPASQTASDKPAEGPDVPDVGVLLPRLKMKVLAGAVIVISGLVPVGSDTLLSEIGMRTTSFGAQVHRAISNRVTHLVISTSHPRTQKIQQAVQLPGIKIVNQNWLLECLRRWHWLDETPYLVKIHSRNFRKHVAANDSDQDTVSEADTRPGLANTRLRLSIVDEKGRRRMLEVDEQDSNDDEGDRLAVDIDNVMPVEYADGEISPIDDLKTFDWGGADDELKEFLGSDDEDEDEDNDVYNQDAADGLAIADVNTSDEQSESRRQSQGHKRKAVDDDNVSDGERSEPNGSSQARKKRTPTENGARHRDSSPRHDSPSRQTADALDYSEYGAGNVDALEADLIAELEAAGAHG